MKHSQLLKHNSRLNVLKLNYDSNAIYMKSFHHQRERERKKRNLEEFSNKIFNNENY